VHAAVDEHAGDAVLVGLADLLDEVLVDDVGEALVVDDDVVALGPVRLLVDGQLELRATAVAFVVNRPLDIGRLESPSARATFCLP